MLAAPAATDGKVANLRMETHYDQQAHMMISAHLVTKSSDKWENKLLETLEMATKSIASFFKRFPNDVHHCKEGMLTC